MCRFYQAFPNRRSQGPSKAMTIFMSKLYASPYFEIAQQQTSDRAYPQLPASRTLKSSRPIVGYMPYKRETPSHGPPSSMQFTHKAQLPLLPQVVFPVAYFAANACIAAYVQIHAQMGRYLLGNKRFLYTGSRERKYIPYLGPIAL